jgi:predicted lipid-binding transport protein (Tim44 family)
MTTIERAFEILARAESSLKELLGTAAQQGDYPALVRLAEWARTIHELAQTNEGPKSVPDPSPAVRRAPAAAATVTSRQTGVPRTKDKQYPNFARAGEELVMLAWSKREKKEYRHKSSHSVLQSLAKAMGERGAAGRVFTTDELLPLHNLADGTDVPNYKVYVAISLLKHTGAIEQHGRSGYSITRNADFEKAVENIWAALPKTQ